MNILAYYSYTMQNNGGQTNRLKLAYLGVFSSSSFKKEVIKIAH